MFTGALCVRGVGANTHEKDDMGVTCLLHPPTEDVCGGRSSLFGGLDVHRYECGPWRKTEGVSIQEKGLMLYGKKV